MLDVADSNLGPARLRLRLLRRVSRSGTGTVGDRGQAWAPSRAASGHPIQGRAGARSVEGQLPRRRAVRRILGAARSDLHPQYARATDPLCQRISAGCARRKRFRT